MTRPLIFFALFQVIDCMNSWIRQDDVIKYFDGKTHNALMLELCNCPVAIRSYNGIFILTYGFIGNVRKMTITFI